MEKFLIPVIGEDETPLPVGDLPTIDGCNYFTGEMPAGAGLTMMSGKMSEDINDKEGWEIIWHNIGNKSPAPELPADTQFVFVASVKGDYSMLNTLKRATVKGDGAYLEWEQGAFATPPGEKRKVTYALVILPPTEEIYYQWNDVNLDEQREQQKAAREEAERARRARFQARAANLPKLL